MTHIKRAVAFGLLVVALVFPTSAFAVSQAGTNTETLTVASTISATFPANTAYVAGNGGLTFATGTNATLYSTPEQVVTIVGTNDLAGATIRVKASDWSQSSITVPVSKRQAVVSGYSGTGTGSALAPAFSAGDEGTWANTSSDIVVASSTGPLAGRQVGINFGVLRSYFSVGGEYSATVDYTASTNSP